MLAMRRLTIAIVLPTLAACSTGGPPLLEDELRAPGATAERTRVVREDRAPLPDRMEEIRAERRAPVSPVAPVAVPAASPAPGDAPPIVPPADFPRAEPAPYQPAPLPAAPTEPTPPPADDPYFAALNDAALEATAPRVGAPARVGADAGPVRAPADGSPFALRGEARPAPPAPSSARTVPPVRTADRGGVPVAAAADRAPAIPPTQASGPARTADAYVADPAATLATINALRARYGLRPLRYDPALSAVALAHARDLAARGEVASTSARGEGVLTRARAQGASPRLAGSLVAGGYADVPSALAAWRGDKSQRDRLLLAEADTLGLALVEDRRSPFRYYIEAIVAAQ